MPLTVQACLVGRESPAPLCKSRHVCFIFLSSFSLFCLSHRLMWVHNPHPRQTGSYISQMHYIGSRVPVETLAQSLTSSHAPPCSWFQVPALRDWLEVGVPEEVWGLRTAVSGTVTGCEMTPPHPQPKSPEIPGLCFRSSRIWLATWDHGWILCREALGGSQASCRATKFNTRKQD